MLRKMQGTLVTVFCLRYAPHSFSCIVDAGASLQSQKRTTVLDTLNDSCSICENSFLCKRGATGHCYVSNEIVRNPGIEGIETLMG